VNNNTVYEWILHSTFTVSAREQSLQSAKPYLSPIVHPGDEILDLFCGSGFVSFWLEGLGANVIAIDFAPYMISLAKKEAAKKTSTVEFIEADIFVQDFGQDRFDLISCFDSISDFPLSDFAKLGKKVASALKPGGRFVVKYIDGSYKYIQGNVAREGVYQAAPERITYRFKEYLPEVGASVNIIRNENRGKEYERKAYIYTAQVVCLAMSDVLKLKQHIVLDEDEFIDIFIKQ
jgi:2-polyprenyl-3-methyl-5-hydroxy-6-metoxy-1,4-benzoquinol methylase